MLLVWEIFGPEKMNYNCRKMLPMEHWMCVSLEGL